MVFITTGQRIATENFSDGVIYKITFVDTTISYMMCVGIGQDFVMLQGPNPSLFCLTMSSASRVSTIDVHDPTPPEPPTPIENALQYQTGEPPFTFTTTTSKLFSWYIEGPCGVETANLFDYETMASGGNGYLKSDGSVVSSTTWNYTDYIPCNGTNFVLSKVGGGSAAICFYDNSKTYIYGQAYQTGGASTLADIICTVPTTAKYIRFTYANSSQGSSAIDLSTIMLSENTAAIPFEPYGYKIPISCNSNLTTIYLDAALGEGEKLYSVNIDTEITTDIGENTLTVNTTDTPTMQIVYGIYAEA